MTSDIRPKHVRAVASLAAKPARLETVPRAVLVVSLLVVARLTVLLRQRSDFFAVDGYAMLQIGLVGLCAVLLASNPQRLLSVWYRLRTTSALWIIIFLAFALLSALWSPLVQYTAYRATEFLVLSSALFFAAAHARSFSQGERILLVSVFCCIALQILGGMRFGGFQNNGLGAEAAMLCCYGVGEAWFGRGARRQRMLFVGGVGLSLVLLSVSLASWWCVFLGSAFACLLPRSRRAATVLMAIFLGLAAVAVGAEKLEPLIFPNDDKDKVVGLHGRSLLWENYWNVFKKQPLLGEGYAVSARISGPVYTTNTHNAFLSVLLGTGVVGVSIVSAGLLFGVREGLRGANRNLPGANGANAALAAGAANSMSIALFGECWMPASFVFMSFFAFHIFAVQRPRWVNRHPPGMPGRAP